MNKNYNELNKKNQQKHNAANKKLISNLEPSQPVTNNRNNIKVSISPLPNNNQQSKNSNATTNNNKNENISSSPTLIARV